MSGPPSLRERFDRFPAQAVLFAIWISIGAVVSLRLRNSVAWVNFQSWYAIVTMHWIGYLAWRSKMAAQKAARQ